MHFLPVHLYVCEKGREEAWSIYFLSIHGKESAKIYTEMVLVFLLRLQFLFYTHLIVFSKVIFNDHITFRIWREEIQTFFYSWKKWQQPVVMYGCESWTVKKAEWRKIDAFELWCWRRLLRVPWTARRPSSPS